MDDPTRVARLLLESASTLARACSARAIVASVDALPDLESVPPRTILVARDEGEGRLVHRFEESAEAVVIVPNVELDRMGQVKLAGIIALSNGILQMGDSVVFLTGPFRSIIDSLVVMTIGSEYELFDTTEQAEIGDHIGQAVFDRALSLALQLGQHGREGKKVGSLMVIGDHARVLEHADQMILNPFKGYSESQRNLLDDRMTETVKEFSNLDGAFIIHGNGVIATAGARLRTGLAEGLPMGLGARHAAAAGITATTKSIAITVSESDGTVRVWRAGKMLASFGPTHH